jgi:hypothetical protein
MQDLSRQHLRTENAPCCSAQLPMRDIAAPYTYCEMCYYITGVNLLLCTPLHTTKGRALLLHFGRNLFLLGQNNGECMKERESRTLLWSFQLYSCAESATSAPALGEHKLLWKRLRVIFILRLIYFLWRMQVGSIFHSGEQLNWGEILFERENRKYHFPCRQFPFGDDLRCFFGTEIKKSEC